MTKFKYFKENGKYLTRESHDSALLQEITYQLKRLADSLEGTLSLLNKFDNEGITIKR